MNAQFTDELRSSMEQFAEHVVMPSGLARRSFLRWRKRRVRAGVSAAAAAMGVIAGAAVALTNVADGSGAQVQDLGGAQVRDLGYVATHVDDALAAASRADDIFFIRTTFTGLSPAAASSFPYRADLAWATRDRFNEVEYSSSGRPFFSLTAARVPGGLRMLTVQYLHQAVIRQELTGFEAELGCSDARGVLATLDLNPNDLTNWPATIRALVGCKLLTAAGHQRVGRADLVRLVQSGGGGYAFASLVVLVNPSTYLPSRMVITWSQPGQRWQTTTQFGLLAPTRANLAHLSAPIPTGFQQVYVPPASASSSGYEAQTFWMFGQ